MLKFLLVVVLFAVAIYLITRAMQGRGVSRPRLRRPPRPERRFVAPDDDEDFLRDLERKRRHPEDPDATG